MDRLDHNLILYRSVGLQELELIYDSGMKAFPTRRPQQPIFYPVLEFEYASQIASGWNAKSGQSAGYVTEFKVEEPYISQFEKHTVGGSEHQEFWIPADDLEEFNRHISGHIKVVEAHFGDTFQGFVPEKFGFQGKNAVEQFTLLANSFLYKRMDFYLEIRRNHKAVFLNYPFWQKYEFKNPGLKEKVLQTIKSTWLTSFPKTTLPLPIPAHKDTPPVKQTDAHSLADEVHEDNPQKEEAQSSSSVNAVDSDLVSIEEIDWDSWEDPVDEDTPPLKLKDTHALADVAHEDVIQVDAIDMHTNTLVNAVDEDVDSIEETDLDSGENPTHEDTPPLNQTDVHALIHPADEDTMPPEQLDSDSLVNPVQEADAPIEPVAPHFVQGLELALNGKYNESIDELSKAVEDDPDNVVARTSLGAALRRVGEDGLALSCYETTLRMDPTYAEAHYFRANILYSQGQVREAIAGYTLAIGLNPELIESHLRPAPQERLTDYSPLLAELYWISKPAQKILHLNKSLIANPEQADLFKKRAAEYYRLRNYVQAIADYSSYLALQPEDANALYLRGLAHEQIEQLDRALEDYQRAIAINPQLSDVYINRGITFGKMGNFRQSIVSLTEGIRLAPQNPNGYFNRGTTYIQEGNFESATEDFSHVIRLSPEDEAAYYWRGISNEETGRQREAIEDYRRFLQLSQDPHARYEIEQKLSQWDAANQNVMSNRDVMPDDAQNINWIPAKESDENLDLYSLIAALGERTLNSIWFGSNVTCYGENAEALYALTAQNKPIDGRDLLPITAGIRQTITGDFQAFDPDATSYWVFIHAWDGNGFYVETNDPKIIGRLKTHFPTAEDVESANPPYESLFIRT